MDQFNSLKTKTVIVTGSSRGIGRKIAESFLQNGSKVIGISSINYMLLCTFALFIRARTLLPNLFYDWGFFIIAILIISSLHYTILTIVFDIPIQYGTLMFSSILTFLVYPLFSKLFNQIYLIDLRQENAK